MTAPVLSPDERAARKAVICHLRSAGYVGRGFDGITRAAFDELAEQAFLRAEAECRGELVCPAGRAQDIDPRSLFRGTRVRAERWASEELLRHWEVVGRLSYDEYVADLIASGLDEVGANEREEESTVTATVAATVTSIDTFARNGERPRGAQGLDEARAFYRQFFHFPSTAHLDAYTLWVGLTHMRDQRGRFVGPVAPRLIIEADTTGAGKSLLGMLTALTCSHGDMVSVPSYWGVVRAISERCMTEIIDNYDTIKRGRSDLLNLLLIGAYDYSSMIRRGKVNEEELDVFGPMAITAVGRKLRVDSDFAPVYERSVVIGVAKKGPEVKLDRFDRRDPEHAARALGIKSTLAKWGGDTAPEYLAYRPELPDGLDNRDRDMWEAIIAVADLAGGDWPERGRRAARALALGESVEPSADDDPFAKLTPAERTMVEVAHVLRRAEFDSVTTVDLLERMSELPGGRRWAVPGAESTERTRILRSRTMALASDLAMFGVVRSSVKVPAGEGRYVNGWWCSDVLPHVPSDLPTFRPSDLSAGSEDEDDVPFE